MWSRRNVLPLIGALCALPVYRLEAGYLLQTVVPSIVQVGRLAVMGALVMAAITFVAWRRSLRLGAIVQILLLPLVIAFAAIFPAESQHARWSGGLDVSGATALLMIAVVPGTVIAAVIVIRVDGPAPSSCSSLCPRTAAMNERNSGCGAEGRDLCSGGNWQPRNHAWFAWHSTITVHIQPRLRAGDVAQPELAQREAEPRRATGGNCVHRDHPMPVFAERRQEATRARCPEPDQQSVVAAAQSVFARTSSRRSGRARALALRAEADAEKERKMA